MLLNMTVPCFVGFCRPDGAVPALRWQDNYRTDSFSLFSSPRQFGFIDGTFVSSPQQSGKWLTGLSAPAGGARPG
jgi:hypothetical protein